MSGIGGHVRRNAHGMGAPGLASPVEPGSALDDGPAPDVDFEAGGMFEGVGGKRYQTEERGQAEGGRQEIG